MNNYTGLKCKKNPKFEFYVLNYDANAKKVIHFNIFQNIRVYERAVNLTRSHVKGEIDFDTFKEELRNIIKWQEWSRRQYEISVGDAFEQDCSKLEKWDCYKQAEPNIELIAKMCIDRIIISQKK